MQNNEFEKYDIKVKEHLLKCLETTSNDIERQIIEYCLKLINIYSFSKNQTYPRPGHPLKSKQKDVYFTMVAILLSLRTTLENEQKATQFFLEHFINIDKVLETDVNTLASIIKCAGMPNKKAETIIKASKFVKEKWQNNWDIFKNMDISKARQILKQIPGFGEKATDCLLVLGLEKTSMAIDVNVLRTTSRLFNFKWANNPDLSNKEQLKYTKDFLEKN
jgi:endonuclease III